MSLIRVQDGGKLTGCAGEASGATYFSTAALGASVEETLPAGFVIGVVDEDGVDVDTRYLVAAVVVVGGRGRAASVARIAIARAAWVVVIVLAGASRAIAIICMGTVS